MIAIATELHCKKFIIYMWQP